MLGLGHSPPRLLHQTLKPRALTTKQCPALHKLVRSGLREHSSRVAPGVVRLLIDLAILTLSGAAVGLDPDNWSTLFILLGRCYNAVFRFHTA